MKRVEQLPATQKAIFQHMEKLLDQLEGNRRTDSVVWEIKNDLATVKQESREAAQRLFELQELVQTSLLLNSSLSLELTLNSVIDAIIRLTGMTRAYLILCAGLDHALTPRVARNWNQDTLPQEDIMFSQTVINQVLHTQKTIISRDAQQELGYISSVREFALDTVICTPLLVQGKLIGVIYGDNYDREKSATGSSNELLLQAFAAQAATAISNAQLYDELRHSREQIVFARDKERRQLGRNLHDIVSNQLAGISYSILAVQGQLEQGAIDKADHLVTGLIRDLDLARENSRRIAHNLYPVELEQLGLIGSLQHYARSYERQFHVSWSVPIHMPVIPAAVEMVVYHIVSEAISNIAHHSNARNCTVELQLTDQSLHLGITDDGQGLSETSANGVGLASMRERAEELAGTFTIRSKRTAGTIISVDLPLQKEVVL